MSFERHVVVQDRALELVELAARLDPEALAERRPRTAIDVEGFPCLPER